MLNKNNFEIAKLASKDETASEAIKGILVMPDKTAATDGHMIIEVTGFEHSGDLLPFEDVVPNPDFDPFIMPAQEALDLSKVFVKSESKDGNLLGIEPNHKGGIAAFALRQAHAEKVFRVCQPDSAFPKYEVVFSPISEEVAHVTLCIDLLIPLLQQLKKITDSGALRIGFYGEEKAVRFDCMNGETQQSARAALMPMKV